MIVRKNRLLQLLLTLLLVTVAFPILLSLIDTRNSSTTYYVPVAFWARTPDSRSDGASTDETRDSDAHSNQSHSTDQLSLLSHYRLVSGDSLDSQLNYRFADLSNRLKHAEMMANDRRYEIYQLLKEIRYLWSMIESHQANRSKHSSQSDAKVSTLPQLTEQTTNRDAGLSISLTQNEMINLPSILSLLPYLQVTPQTSFNPVFRVASSTPRNITRFVFGIPTVKRQVESYLISTLENLIQNLSPVERKQSCFVVFIAETDLNFVRKTADEIVIRFRHEIDDGLIEIISPPALFYPNLAQIKPTLGDPIERVRWRSKQNFDFAYLMMYCQSKGIYYVQLEDDIITKPSYLTKMESFIAKNALLKRDWLILDFCSLGFIGKLFRSVELPRFVLFFAMFYNDKPVDWLLDNYVQTKVCRIDRPSKECKKQKDAIWLVHKPSLFQHIGTHSSLHGKIQKLRDRGFGKMKLYEPHVDNPVASVSTSIQHYKRYSLNEAYAGRGFFWGFSPITNDTINFKYQPPVLLERCLIRTGSVLHPEDILYNASLLIKPLSTSSLSTTKFKVLEDNFVHLAQFDYNKGLVDVLIPGELNPVVELRVVNEHNSSHWLIINEIYVKELDSTESTRTVTKR